MLNYLKLAAAYIFRNDDAALDAMVAGPSPAAEARTLPPYKADPKGAAIFMSWLQPGEKYYYLLDAEGNEVGTYSRRRDAVRGATRRGLRLAA